MVDNTMIFWDKMRRPPENALRPITGGRLKGKTDISPQWRFEIMTEVFGVCGVGWKYTVDRKWTETATDGQVFAFADVSIYILYGSTWSDAIPGSGGSMLIAKETGGLHSNDEAFKMAVTDALSVAMKALGVASDIYMGLWDGSKYSDEKLDKKVQKEIQYITKQQVEEIKKTIKEKNIDEKVFLGWAQAESIEKIQLKNINQVIKTLNKAEVRPKEVLEPGSDG